MKIKWPKILSILCFAFAVIFIFTYFLKYYNQGNKVVYTEKNIIEDNQSIKSKSTNNNYIEETELIEVKEKDSNEVEVIETETEKDTSDTMENIIIYDGETLDEIAQKINKSLVSTLTDKGYLYASYSLEKGVNPYLAVAISLEETGCTWGCSQLVVNCNNVGGMKGSGCGSYASFSSIDDGIKAFIDNIANNYVAYGLTTAEAMNPKYAENPMWASNVNAYIDRIKNK